MTFAIALVIVGVMALMVWWVRRNAPATPVLATRSETSAMDSGGWAASPSDFATDVTDGGDSCDVGDSGDSGGDCGGDGGGD